MPLSRDPDRRRRQLDNLNRGAATKHGAHSEAKLAPLRDRFLTELREQFGDVAGDDELTLAAERRAKLEVLNDWLDRAGLLERSGRPRAAVQLADRVQSAYERQLANLRARSRGQRSGGPMIAPLELTEDEEMGLMSSNQPVREDTAHRILDRIGEDHHAEWLRSTGADDSTIRTKLERRRARIAGRRTCATN
jgi:hypothetical protein